MRSNIGPLLLIGIGTFFLLSNFGVLRLEAIKDLLATWWPLILIVVGAMQLQKRWRR